jgi:hypothetical protein
MLNDSEASIPRHPWCMFNLRDVHDKESFQFLIGRGAMDSAMAGGFRLHANMVRNPSLTLPWGGIKILYLATKPHQDYAKKQTILFKDQTKAI